MLDGDAGYVSSLIVVVILGLSTLSSYYYIFWQDFYMPPEHESQRALYRREIKQKWLWAAYAHHPYYGNIPFIIWVVFSSTAAISFLYLFVTVICNGHATTGYFAANISFLFFSLLYAPLVVLTLSKDDINDMYEIAVVVDLFLVAASAWCMVGVLVPSNDAPNIAASVLLAFHCTVMDTIIWAYVWVTDDAIKDAIYRRELVTDELTPSTRITVEDVRRG